MLDIDKIHLGDCLELMPSIPSKSIDMILCDLPYGTTDCEWDSIIDMGKLWQEYERVIKDNGAIVLTAQGMFTAKLMVFREKWFKYDYVWIKNLHSNFALTGIQPHRICEDILIFKNPKGAKETFHFDSRIKKMMVRKRNDFSRDVYGGQRENKDFISKEYENYPKNVLYYNVERGMHPTQKPVALFEYLIKTYTNEGDLVLDNCSGSGTTAIACLNSSRHFICIEKDETYYKRSLDRIADHEPLLHLGDKC
jgi:site-specific DNA-methyltransferase (adenine-specific)